ncbi:histidine ammonia-lyase [Brevibacterium sp. 50QC2O2]|uniref:histidine ammonia-lyase n=1 Tax=unclassified Brevibacterium TaxID=2614124 RepID=UPI00211CD341|nr:MULTISPECIES: histidine ammonia-lyase [unclassified Brevibacterium]MCQ9367051.1 histidine ammonia-lyase [Brevibacterium sp. 91QC2O2]MCQ9388265.1 histidine ammonia-lyase [Brevibacterium sp. 50QC2O2]
MTVELDPQTLTFAQVIAVARHDEPVTLPAHVREQVIAARRSVERLATSEKPVYGVSTGFGALAQRHIPAESRAQLQKSLIRSHAAGVGEPVEREVVRALMLLRARTLATGRTGVKPETLDAYIALLNAGITPWVHEFGSLGCSGDLAPLSACALVVMGEGLVHDPAVAAGAAPRAVDAAEVLTAAGITPVALEEKEGLALVNGTDGMLGQLIMALFDLEKLLSTADLSAAMSVESQLGTDTVFQPELHYPLRPFDGQALSAANMATALRGSAIVAGHKDSTHLVQDAYSLRCTPQVTGAARDALAYAANVAARELRAAIDNPVVLDSGMVSSNGNFHGAPLAHAMDFLAIVVADAASIAERRTDRAMDPARNQGLHAFLADDPGVDSGLMIAHYTQAALVSETKRLAAPASVDSIPSSAMQEDHVSMGWHAARKLRKAVDNLTSVLGIELYAAARATELRDAAPAPVTGAVIAGLRELVPGCGPDRFMSPELAATIEYVRSGSALTAAEAATGPARAGVSADGAGEQFGVAGGSTAGGLGHTLTDTDGTVLSGVGAHTV